MEYLLSFCYEIAVVNDSRGKPNIILVYNQRKCKVDSFDQICSLLNVMQQQDTHRWSMALFYLILSIVGVNFAIIYGNNMMKKNEKPLNRRKFMKQFSEDLVTTWMENLVTTRSSDIEKIFTRKYKKNFSKIYLLQKTKILCFWCISSS